MTAIEQIIGNYVKWWNRSLPNEQITIEELGTIRILSNVYMWLNERIVIIKIEELGTMEARQSSRRLCPVH